MSNIKNGKRKYIIYTQHNCIFCNKAKNLFKENNIEFDERLLDTPEKLKRFKASGYKTVPQIFFCVGGYEQLEQDLFIEEHFKDD